MKRENALIDEMLFPGEKGKAFTMSYDDGTVHDRRMVEIMNRYGIRGTFNLNAGFLNRQRAGFDGLDISTISEEEVSTLYRGHEVAGHGYNHASPADIGTSAFMYETIEDKAALEELTGKLVRGYAYPFGIYNDQVKQVLKLAGYHYARPVETTGNFLIPKDFLEWKGTCHHDDPRLMELAENFVKEEMFGMGKKLFYVWGHSYEFEWKQHWNLLEKLCAFMQEHGENIWFATNIEIAEYAEAYRRLEYSADAGMIYNPSALEVILRRDGKIIHIKPGETVKADQ